MNKYVCATCNNSFKSRQALWSHRKKHEDEKETNRILNCLLKSAPLIPKSVPAPDKKEKIDKMVNVKKRPEEKPKVQEEPKVNLCDLYERNFGQKKEEQKIGSDQEMTDSSSDEDQSNSEEEKDSDSGADNLDFLNLVKITTENLTRNDKKQICRLLKGEESDIVEVVESYLDGEQDIEEISRKLDKSLNTLKIKILLRRIEKTTLRIRDTYF